jgi:hypothetical protein
MCTERTEVVRVLLPPQNMRRHGPNQGRLSCDDVTYDLAVDFRQPEVTTALWIGETGVTQQRDDGAIGLTRQGKVGLGEVVVGVPERHVAVVELDESDTALKMGMLDRAG